MAWHSQQSASTSARNSMTDFWREIPGWEGFYEVSRNGEIRSMTRRIPNSRGFDVIRRSQHRKLTTDKYGYKVVLLNRAAKYQTRKVHHLVLEAFIGPRPDDSYETLHINGNPADNRVENLRWGTQQENNEDKIRHSKLKGASNPVAKLTAFQAFMAMESPLPNEELAKHLNVKPAAIKTLKRGQSWSWL